MNPLLGQIIVWLIIGCLAGTLAGRLVTFKKVGLGRWTNLAVGLIGALIGGGVFKVFHIDLGLGEIKLTFEDLIAAFLGSVLFVVVWLAGSGARRWGSRLPPSSHRQPPPFHRCDSEEAATTGIASKHQSALQNTIRRV